MYPYEKYNAEFYTMDYNRDGTLENEIFIIVDKMVNNTWKATRDKRLIDVLFDFYRNNSVECCDTVDNIISICLDEYSYKYVQILAEYMHTVETTFAHYG